MGDDHICGGTCEYFISTESDLFECKWLGLGHQCNLVKSEEELEERKKKHQGQDYIIVNFDNDGNEIEFVVAAGSMTTTFSMNVDAAKQFVSSIEKAIEIQNKKIKGARN